MVLVLLAIAFFAFLALLILGSGWLSHRNRVASLKVIGEALQSGHQVDPALVDRLMRRAPAPVGKWYAIVCFLFAASGLAVFLALGLGAYVFADGVELGESGRAGMMVGAYINGCVGGGYLALGLMSLHYFTGRARPAPKWDYGTVLALLCLLFGVGGLSAGAGLTLGAIAYSAIDPSGRTFSGMMIAALMNFCTGAALTILGVAVFRLFGELQSETQTVPAKPGRTKADA